MSYKPLELSLMLLMMTLFKIPEYFPVVQTTYWCIPQHPNFNFYPPGSHNMATRWPLNLLAYNTLPIFRTEDIEPQKQQCPCECEASRTVHRGKIVGGLETVPHEYPWLAAIFVTKILYCGGTIITHSHILTASHCLDRPQPEYLVMLGAHDLRDEQGDVYEVIEMIKHPNYKPYHNDIALLKLSRRIQFSDNVRAGCLPQTWVKTYAGEMGVVTGWGKMGEKSVSSETVRKVGIPIIPLEECARHYPVKELSEHMICAGYAEGKKDACQGDSGGPLHIVNNLGYYEIIGIVSFGRGCARPHTPGVYTKVVDFLDWVKQSIGDECICNHPTF